MHSAAVPCWKVFNLVPNIHRVDEDAFSGTAMLNAIDADTIILGGYILYAIGGTETDFTVPDGVTVITASACKSALTSLDLNQTVYVGDAAFRNCTDLASVTGTDSLRSVGRGAFDGTAYLNAISDDLVMIGSCSLRISRLRRRCCGTGRNGFNLSGVL